MHDRAKIDLRGTHATQVALRWLLPHYQKGATNPPTFINTVDIPAVVVLPRAVAFCGTPKFS